MLPTTGHFKDIDCPYFTTSCDRPYCHFKHRKKNQDSIETITASVVNEVPTYNPTPKSQLANNRSHIPITYVPDIIRTDRSNFRSLPSYGSSDNKPTYKPTPLSMLSTKYRTNSSITSEITSVLDKCENTKNIAINEDHEPYNPEFPPVDACDINFEDLSTEFDMIDEIISDTGSVTAANTESESTEDEKSKYSFKKKSATHDTSESKHKLTTKHGSSKSSSKSKLQDSKKYTKHESKKDSSKEIKKKSRSEHKGKSKSSSGEKQDKETSSKHSSSTSRDKKAIDSKSSSSSSKDKKKSSSKEENNKERKDKHESKSKDRHTSKSKYRDKNKEKSSVVKVKSKEIKTKDNRYKQPESEESNGFNSGPEFIADDSDMEDDEDTLQECFKIFNEYKPPVREPEPMETNKTDIGITEDAQVNLSKKRVAYENADKITTKNVYNKPKSIQSPALIMANRLRLAKQAQANNEQNNLIAEMNRQSAAKLNAKRHPTETLERNNSKVPKFDKIRDIKSKINVSSVKNRNSIVEKVNSMQSSSCSIIDDIISGKTTSMPAAKPKRIAPATNVGLMQRAKARIEEMARLKSATAINKTTSQTFGKGGTRVAHVPDISLSDLPDVLQADKSKLPVNVRTRYLTMLADECVKLYLTKEDAYARALNEELKCYERCSALVTYRNSAMLAINRIRKEHQEREKSGAGPLSSGEVTSKVENENPLRGRLFYENIKGYILTDEELDIHGYPQEGLIHGRAIIKNQKPIQQMHLDDNERKCARCSKLYQVDEDGFPVYKEECMYHPLKKRTLRGESTYLCCKTSDDAGCVISNTHVCDSNSSEADLDGYQTTMPPENEDDPRSYAVYALDCEMCYTTKGLELTRVTVVNPECKTVYETLVKPLNPIIDYNTRFSGITKSQMERTATSILQVQANILHLCNSKTILIGHSLESDMKALKIVHSTIIDTSVLFPHKFGLPHKRALKALASDYLKKIIQNDISGHDSAEDALTCMELVIWKVREELKARGIKT